MVGNVNANCFHALISDEKFNDYYSNAFYGGMEFLYVKMG